MFKEDGLVYQLLILGIIIVIAGAGVLINKVIGKDGMVNSLAQVENNYTKEDVLEKINYKVTQKFIELNNVAHENGQNISEIYNSDVVINFLLENEIIIGTEFEGRYCIDINRLNDEQSEEKDTNNYRLEKRENGYMITYYDENSEMEDLGELQVQQTM